MPGTPGRAPGVGPPRPAGGRGAVGLPPSGPGRGARGWPIPWEEANGLLPGRGVPGRRPLGPGVPGSPPVEPGRGRGGTAEPSPDLAAGAAWPGARGTTGRGTGVGCGGAGCSVARAAGAAGAEGAVGTAAAGAGGVVAAGGAGGVAAGASAGTSTGVGAAATCSPSAVFAAAAFFVVAFLTGGGSLASFSLRRLSTGASTVEEADRTNSPMSFSMLRTVLLSTPSSFASS